MRRHDGRITVGGLVATALVVAALLIWGLSRRQRWEDGLKARLSESIAQIDGYEDDEAYYLQLVELGHDSAFDVVGSRGAGGRRARSGTRMLNRYRTEAFNAMIARARRDGRDDIAVALSRRRGADL